MADNIPSAAEGEEHRLPANAEDRKAAAALNSLNDNEISQDGSNKLSSAAAQEALGKAMSRLEIAAGGAAGKAGGASKVAAGTAETAVKKKAVKIVAEDVTLLVRLFSFLGNV
jgi:tryptophan synthase beta subunit